MYMHHLYFEKEGYNKNMSRLETFDFDHKHKKNALVCFFAMLNHNTHTEGTIYAHTFLPLRN